MPLYDRIADQILNSGDGDMIHSAKTVLRCMVVASRPLSLRELVVIASLPTDHSDEVAILEDLVLGLCGSMIDVRDGIVYFVHTSARDYIISSSSLVPDGFSSCHQQVALASFDYLRDSHYTGDFSPKSSELATASYGPPEYPILFWMDHAGQSAGFSNHYLLENADFFEQNSKAFNG